MKAIFIFLFITTTAFAQSTVSYNLGRRLVIFEKVDGIFVNKACAPKKDCLAYKKSQEFKDKLPSSEVTNGKNPSAVKCKTMLDGQVLIGRNKKGHEQSFCVFSDESYLMN